MKTLSRTFPTVSMHDVRLTKLWKRLATNPRSHPHEAQDGEAEEDSQPSFSHPATHLTQRVLYRLTHSGDKALMKTFSRTVLQPQRQGNAANHISLHMNQLLTPKLLQLAASPSNQFGSKNYKTILNPQSRPLLCTYNLLRKTTIANILEKASCRPLI